MKFIRGLPREAKRGEMVSFDIEMYQQEEGRLHRPTGSFACISFAFDDGVYQLYDKSDLKEAFKRIDKGLWIGHNLMYDIRQLRRWIDIKQRSVWDTMLVERAMYGGYYDAFSLDALVRRYLGKKLKKDVRNQFASRSTMTKEMENYSAVDGRTTLQVANEQKRILEEEWDDPLDCYWKIDGPAIWSMMDMPPVKIDVDGWIEMVKGFEEECKVVQEELGVNVKANIQVAELIKEVTGERLPLTKKGNPKTGKDDVLIPLRTKFKLAGYDEGVELMSRIMRARTLRQAISTWGTGYIDKHVEADGFIYASWKVTGAETGRTACSDPNLMNIPVRDLSEYRNQFISKFDKGTILVSDVSQQEVRIVAALSDDKVMLKVFETDEDPYLYVCKLVFDNTSQRFEAKTVTLGSIYGLSPYGMARQSDLSEDDAQYILNVFFRRFTGIDSYIGKSRSQAKNIGFVTTASGRRFWNNPHSSQWRRNAINSPIQGSGADQLKMTMNTIHKEAALRDLPYCVTMPEHDELVCDVEPGYMRQYRPLVKRAWIEAGKELVPTVPMKVDVVSGPNWGVKSDD